MSKKSIYATYLHREKTNAGGLIQPWSKRVELKFFAFERPKAVRLSEIDGLGIIELDRTAAEQLRNFLNDFLED